MQSILTTLFAQLALYGLLGVVNVAIMAIEVHLIFFNVNRIRKRSANRRHGMMAILVAIIGTLIQLAILVKGEMLEPKWFIIMATIVIPLMAVGVANLVLSHPKAVEQVS